ncbi:hypothetical protein BV363_01081 [Pseudomonas syringae pv. actinidiae]|uniref:Uncharacterized protein n=1 Tax=Pseudomonas syringae pv. actinidiae TaxID=103796 RepID=A0A2P0QG85_PSESF|nr:hypothetical protein [Pseudomonas syringae pv. actinidiae]OSO54088.1 hypothetical protein BV363_01081 [Pseudomonas syringae pv. actinidiae]
MVRSKLITFKIFQASLRVFSKRFIRHGPLVGPLPESNRSHRFLRKMHVTAPSEVAKVGGPPSLHHRQGSQALLKGRYSIEIVTISASLT